MRKIARSKRNRERTPFRELATGLYDDDNDVHDDDDDDDDVSTSMVMTINEMTLCRTRRYRVRSSDVRFLDESPPVRSIS